MMAGMQTLDFKLQKTDRLCPNCNNPMYKLPNKNIPPVCRECGQKRLREKTKELELLGGDIVNKRDTYDWLKHRSLLTDATLKRADFESYRADYSKESELNYSKAKSIAEEYLKGSTFNSFIQGVPGVGKSHLAMSMLKHVNENAKPYKRCLFVSIDQVVREIKDSWDNPNSRYTEHSIIELLNRADVLVIDDLGAEVGSIDTMTKANNFIIRILYAVVNSRMDKPTIFTTNLDVKRLRQIYDDKLVSRMFRGVKGHALAFKETKDYRMNLEV